MKVPKFISVAEAADIAGVTTETIRNLCKARAINFKKRGIFFTVSEDDILQYKSVINEVHHAECDIEEYVRELHEQKDEYRKRLLELREQCKNMQMFPQRITAIFKTLYYVLAHYSTDRNGNLTNKEIEIMQMYLLGNSMVDMAKKYHVTTQCVSEGWRKALRRYATSKNEIVERDEMIDEMRETIKEQNKRIHELENGVHLEDYTPDYIKTAKFLMTNILDLDLSVRCTNCLICANIETVYDLVMFHRADLLKFRNFGKKSLRELDELLEDNGLAFGMDVSRYDNIILDLKTKHL